MTEQELLQELCGGCNGCSTRPVSIGGLCSNPLEKYVGAKASFEAGVEAGKEEATKIVERLWQMLRKEYGEE